MIGEIRATATRTIWAHWEAGLQVSLLSLGLMVAGLPFYFWARRSAAAEQPGEAGAVG